jgi:hypothetical protein
MPYKNLEERRLKQKLQKQKKREGLRSVYKIEPQIIVDKPIIESQIIVDKPIIEPQIILDKPIIEPQIIVDKPIIEMNILKGFIYCLSNPAFEGIYKIGFTTTSIKQRISELNNTSVPFNFKCEFYKKVSNCRQEEKKLHLFFTNLGYRVNDKREFFKVNIELIRNVFNLIEECN